HADVGRVDRGGLHGDADLPRSRVADRPVDDLEHLGAAGGPDSDSTYRAIVAHGRQAGPPAPVAPRSRPPCSTRAATMPPIAPNRCPCHEMPSAGTRPRNSVVPHTASTTSPTAIWARLRV